MTFLPQELESCAEIQIVDDLIALEGTETIVVTFVAPDGTQQGNIPTSTISIVDNDGESAVEIMW